MNFFDAVYLVLWCRILCMCDVCSWRNTSRCWQYGAEYVMEKLEVIEVPRARVMEALGAELVWSSIFVALVVTVIIARSCLLLSCC